MEIDLNTINFNEGVEEVTPETLKICEIRNFTDGEGRMIIGHYPIDDIEHPSFKGVFVVPTNMGTMRIPIEFDNGLTLEECFSTFDNCAETAIEEKQKEANDRSRIVTMDQLRNTGNIFTK